MTTYPKSFASVIDSAVKRHKSNIDAAVDWAMGELAELPEWEEWQQQAIRRAVASLVHHRRGDISCPRDQRPSATHRDYVPAIQRREIDLPDVASQIAESITLDYMIGGKTLGTLYGKELVGLAEKSWSTGQRNLMMSHLCAQLYRIVPREKQVKDVVSEGELSKIASQVANGSILMPPACVEAA